MSSITQSRTPRDNAIAHVSSGSGAVLGSIAVLLAASLAIAFSLPHGLVLPALALAATILAGVGGVAAWAGRGAFRASALTCAGIFALAAIAAAMLGDPDQVALFLK